MLTLHSGGGRAAVRDPGALALEDYSLEQLADIVVTSVSRRQERLGSAPVSVYVIGSAEIARSGAATIPEALRASREPRTDFSGANLVTRFDARLGGGATLRLQAWAEQQLRSSHDLGAKVSADLLLRRVARLPQPAVPGYHELDVRIAWQARPDAEPALTGRNLLHAHHPEFGAADLRQLAERHVFASATLRF